MKKFLFFLVVLCFAMQALSQNGASINSTGIPADPSAMLDISSQSSGLLIPRMTTNERNLIVSPAEGLQIFNTTTKCFEFFAYGIWQTGICAVCPLPANAGTVTGSDMVCPGQNNVSYSVPAISNAVNYIWNYSGSGITITGATNSITINFSASATSGNLTVYGNNSCGNGNVSDVFTINVGNTPSTPAAGTHVSSQTSVTWNWNSVTGATGYKYNSINDYATATDNLTGLSYTQTGLSCNTSYNLYVWAYGYCGYSGPVLLTKTTNACCGTGTNVTFTYRGSSVTYGTVVGQNSTCWLDRNLGATKKATSYDDSQAYGDLFQWGRLDDGHQLRSSTKTTTRSTTDNPGNSYFITWTSSPYDWRNPQNPSLWQTVSGSNNPCPTGWRIPTLSELDSERASWSTQDRAGAFSSSLKLTSGGGRSYYDGTLTSTDYGYYWASNTNGTESRCLLFGISQANMTSYSRGYGFSVRCIRN